MENNSNDSLNEHFEKIRPLLAQTESRVGDMIVYKNDNIVSQAIGLYGEYCHAEINIMARYLDKDSLYLDIGTNIGYHAKGINHEVGCNVIGFEPHPSHFCVAAYNCQGKNILLYHTALGNKTGTIDLTDFDHGKIGNYGEITTVVEDDDEVITVPLKKLDTFNLDKCTLMKIDVEGAELSVLQGATKTIKKHRPVIFYEAIDKEVWMACHSFLDTREYKQYWVTCKTKPLAPPFRLSDANPFGNGGVSNILAVPTEKEQPTDLVEVIEGETYDEMVNRMTSYRILF